MMGHIYVLVWDSNGNTTDITAQVMNEWRGMLGKGNFQPLGPGILSRGPW